MIDDGNNKLTEKQKECVKILELLIKKTKGNDDFSVMGVTYNKKSGSSGLFGGLKTNDVSSVQSTISMFEIYKSLLVDQLTKLCFTKENNATKNNT